MVVGPGVLLTGGVVCRRFFKTSCAHPPASLPPSRALPPVRSESLLRVCLRACAVGGFSSKGALNRVSAAAGTFTLKKLECSERAVQACIR